MTVAGGAFVASKVIQSKPGGPRLYLQRKNIQFSHKLGLIDDLQAATAYESLRRHYERMVKSRPLVLAQSRKEEVKSLFYTGPFRGEMTQREARLILGVTEAEAKDSKLITKKWRGMMLKNHPDTGGSPFVAAKINEAKEIIMGEKTAKEGSEEEDEEDGSSGLDDETAEEKEKKRKKAAQEAEDIFGMQKKAPVEKHPDLGSIRDHPVTPYYEWKNVQMDELGSKASPRPLYYLLKEDTFHRKATRTKPHFKPLDSPEVMPDERWKDRYLEDVERLRSMKEMERNSRVRFVRDPYVPTAENDVGTTYGHYEDLKGNKVDVPAGHTADSQLGYIIREYDSGENERETISRNAAIERVRAMADAQARAKSAVARAKKLKNEKF